MSQRGGISGFGVFVSGATMSIAVARQRSLAAPTVRANTAASLDCFLNRFCQSVARSIVQHGHADAPNPATSIFSSYKYQRLAFCSATAFAGSFATYKGLIHLNQARKFFSARTHHSPTQLMQPRPRCLVTF